jgi:hypothetical protein
MMVAATARQRQLIDPEFAKLREFDRVGRARLRSTVERVSLLLHQAEFKRRQAPPRLKVPIEPLERDADCQSD